MHGVRVLLEAVRFGSEGCCENATAALGLAVRSNARNKSSLLQLNGLALLVEVFNKMPFVRRYPPVYDSVMPLTLLVEVAIAY